MSRLLNALSASDAARRLQRRELSAQALLRDCLARIAARESEVRASSASTPRLRWRRRGRSTPGRSAARCTACRWR